MQITELDLCEITVPSDPKICDRFTPLNESYTPKFIKLFLLLLFNKQNENVV